jgi:hypothetical protein
MIYWIVFGMHIKPIGQWANKCDLLDCIWNAHKTYWPMGKRNGATTGL